MDGKTDENYVFENYRSALLPILIGDKAISDLRVDQFEWIVNTISTAAEDAYKKGQKDVLKYIEKQQESQQVKNVKRGPTDHKVEMELSGITYRLDLTQEDHDELKRQVDGILEAINKHYQ